MSHLLSREIKDIEDEIRDLLDTKPDATRWHEVPEFTALSPEAVMRVDGWSEMSGTQPATYNLIQRVMLT